MNKITDANGFEDMRALRRVARDARIREIEGGGMDDGRVFLHLRSGYVFDGYASSSKSVGDDFEIRHAVALIRKK